jgi:hypothetical protein
MISDRTPGRAAPRRIFIDKPVISRLAVGSAVIRSRLSPILERGQRDGQGHNTRLIPPPAPLEQLLGVVVRSALVCPRAIAICRESTLATPDAGV